MLIEIKVKVVIGIHIFLSPVIFRIQMNQKKLNEVVMLSLEVLEVYLSLGTPPWEDKFSEMSKNTEETVTEEKKAFELYDELAQIPKVSGGKLIENSNSKPQITLKFSQTDTRDNSTISFSKSYIPNVEDAIPGFVPNDHYFHSQSPSGKFHLFFKDLKADPKKNRIEETRLEFWSSEGRLFSIGCKEIHGKVCTVDDLQRVFWNHDETEILYLAESIPKKKKKYFEEVKDEEKEEFEFYKFEEHFGELMTEIKNPSMFHLKINEKKLFKVDGIPENLGISEPILTPENDYLFAGIDLTERKIGRIYCIQRRNSLYLLEKESKKLTKLLQNEWNFHHFVFSKNGKELFFLTTGKESVHRPSQILKKITWQNRQDDEKAVQIVDNLYVLKPLKSSSWLDDDHLILNVIKGFHLEVVILDVTNGSISIIENPLKHGSVILLDVLKKDILISVQTPFLPYSVHLIELNDKLKETASKKIVTEKKISKLFQSFEWKVSTLQKEKFKIEYLSLNKKDSSDEKKLPLIVNPHGGPHSASLSIFRFEMICYVLSGFAVMNINYRGSIGYTKEFIDLLPGNVGDFDVKDCHDSVLDFVKNSNNIDQNRISVLGGSHGGFLGGHLMGQYPDFYNCAILHNPVTNIASMLGISDIPDWCFCEAGYDPYKHEYMTPEILEKAFKISPMFHVKKVKNPILFLLGEVDLRVPIEQGKQFYFALKSRKIETKLLMYPDLFQHFFG
eukprot:gene11086-3792_t